MKPLTHLMLLAGLVGAPLVAAAESPHTLAFNVGATTDYVFRGVSQTQNGPAIQGGVDYSHTSGLYAGFWASNVSWVNEGTPGGYKDNNSMETDFYGGYKGSVGGVGYDIGLIRYYYPGDDITGVTSPDTTEVYVAGSWKFLTLKYSYAISDYFIAWGGPGAKSKGSGYLELNATYDLGNGWGLLGHLGHQKVENTGIASYTDWKLGVTKDVGIGVVTLAYTDTDADTPTYTWNGDEVADGRAILSFSKSF